MKERAKSWVKQQLARRGYELSGRGDPRRTATAVLEHVKQQGFKPAAVIDVGVAWGTPELYDAFPDARFLLVEPLDTYTEALEQIKRRLDADYVLAAAGPEPGSITINVHRAPTLSSTLGQWKGKDEGGERRKVPVVRIDDLVAERSLPGPYVVKVDVEGAELDVLAGGLVTLEQTELVLLEVNLFQFLPGQPQLHDVVAWMKEHGFVTYDFYGGHLRLLDGALAMVNMAFVREDGRFRQSHEFATPAQAEAMYRGWGF
jgi:FkbM family methyltransferase